MELNGRHAGEFVSVRRNPSTIAKLLSNLPWLLRYPAWRARALGRSIVEKIGKQHLIVVVANHFEPAYNEEPDGKGGFGIPMEVDSQLRRFDQ
jgi:hypothetical protein